ncbi:nucleotide-diphospho-sugar transferase [Suillus variegatus]|nr:nucleotide-diphospho-sugar transferase [Suillus variegatus]
MMTPMHYILPILGVMISIYYIMSFTYEEYGKATSISNIAEQWTGPKSNPLHKTPVPDEYCKPDSSKHLQDRRANASIVVLTKDQKKVYGFTIAISEIPATIPTLWNVVKSFIDANPDLVTPGNAMEFLSDDGGVLQSVSLNFEIADLDFWRGEAYSKFFEYLDEQGGFYYEHWGDAPVHSIGAALFTKKEQIHFFNDIRYRHDHFEHCPQADVHTKGKCWCNSDKSVGKYLCTNVELPLKLVASDYQVYSCLYQYDKLLL